MNKQENCVFCGEPAPSEWYEISGWMSVVKLNGKWEDAFTDKSNYTAHPAHESCYDKRSRVSAAAAALGSITSERKAEQSRINGKRGGRPRRTQTEEAK